MVTVEMCKQDGIDRIGADAPLLQSAHGRSAAVEQETDGTAVDVDTCLESASTTEGVSATEELDADLAHHKGCWMMPPNEQASAALQVPVGQRWNATRSSIFGDPMA